MRQGNMDSSGEGMTLAGKVLGILATVMFLLGILAVIAGIVIVATSYRGF